METMSNQGYLRYENRLRMRGKYLNVFGKCAERIYAPMEKTEKGSWCILQIRHYELIICNNDNSLIDGKDFIIQYSYLFYMFSMTGIAGNDKNSI